MIACGEAEGGSNLSNLSTFGKFVQNIKKLVCTAGVWLGRRRSGRPAPRPRRTLLSRRHILRLIRMILTRFLWPITIREAATPAQSIFPARPSPPTAGRRSHASPRLAVKVPLPAPKAILLPCPTSQPGPGSPCGLTQPAALRGSVGISPLLLRMLPVGHIFAFTMRATTIANLVGLTTTLPPHSMGVCIFPGALPLCPVATYSSDNGATWHAPITVAGPSPFIRDVQITGDLNGNGVVYLAGMDEGGGGFPHN